MASANVLMSLLLLVVGSSASAEEFRWHGRVAAGQTIEIKGVSGAIEAEPASGGEVEVLATKTGRRSNPSEVEIKVVEHGGGVTICAVYPKASSGAPNECVPGSGGRMNTHDNDVKVAFSVKVPAGVRFVGRTVNGGIEADRLDGDVEAHTVNGGVQLSTAGHARAETVNGSISARMGRADWTGPVEFETVNGSITLELPESMGAEVSAETVNGRIDTDFDIKVSGRFSRRHLSGAIGEGGRELRIKTVNGSIELRRAH